MHTVTTDVPAGSSKWIANGLANLPSCMEQQHAMVVPVIDWAARSANTVIFIAITHARVVNNNGASGH